MNNLKICLTDDHSLFREGLHFLLDQLDYVEEIRETCSGADCIALIKTWTPDIIFMDIEMPGLNGVECTHKVHEINPDIKIIALSMYTDENYYSSMIEAGASGFILKNSGFDEVKKALTDVCSGHLHFSPTILDSFVKNTYLSNKRDKRGNKNLSSREIEILQFICKGFSNQEIAKILSISKRTVDKHRENILLKTETRNTAGLVMYAVREGFVDTNISKKA